MSTAATSAFASLGARTEHLYIGPGRPGAELGRVLRSLLDRLRARRERATHESIAISRANERSRDTRYAGAQRLRLHVGLPIV